MKTTLQMAIVFVVAICLFSWTGEVSAQPQSLESQTITIDYSTVPSEIVVDAALVEQIPSFAPCLGMTLDLHENFVEAQKMFNERIIGYRDDMPRIVRENMDGAIVTVALDFVDGEGNVLAFAGPDEIFTFNINSVNVFRQRLNVRPWALTQIGSMTIDIDDLCFMISTDEFVPTIVHEAMHAIGFGPLFEDNELAGPVNLFNQIGYNYEGYALAKYREEAQVPFALFIGLQQPGGGHWNPFDPFFDQPSNGMRDVMHPFAAPPGWEIFYSETTWSVFADLGYKVRKVNAPALPGG